MPSLSSIADLLKAGWKHERGMFVSPRNGALMTEQNARYAEWAMRRTDPKKVETPANHYK